ncbi:phage gp6-like head-tail connector protein [Rhizobium grahamii]|uniref:Phage gp6-like head-tail connector protein n=1 Tax=Rhizobium grahamii TaxID=1120045 RepID=A0A5Q0C533_9HYPH|nr:MULTISPECIES: head-tail connector protein [Rhizobium]QFY60365.1 phage gp6-like head-tail connector protein [Rhizobium grahamii]QRM50509.1 phage gp6-like head-tail connector protein [Rhizobium sp. BG6]
MAVVTLDEMKAHLGVTDDADNTLIEGKIAAAQAWIEQYLGYEIETEFPDEVPADLVDAVKQQAAHAFENRESTVVGVTIQAAPNGVEDVIRNRRNYSWQ